MTLDPDSLRILTNPEMIACNQNGVMGKMVGRRGGVQCWLAEEKGNGENRGWIGIFNRMPESKKIFVTAQMLGLSDQYKYHYYDIWNKTKTELGKKQIELEPNGCLFLRYEKDNPLDSLAEVNNASITNH
jgi:hypothetical protein